MKNRSLWEGPMLEKFMKDCLLWARPMLEQGKSMRRKEQQRQHTMN